MTTIQINTDAVVQNNISTLTGFILGGYPRSVKRSGIQMLKELSNHDTRYVGMMVGDTKLLRAEMTNDNGEHLGIFAHMLAGYIPEAALALFECASQDPKDYLPILGETDSVGGAVGAVGVENLLAETRMDSQSLLRRSIENLGIRTTGFGGPVELLIPIYETEQIGLKKRLGKAILNSDLSKDFLRMKVHEGDTVAFMLGNDPYLGPQLLEAIKGKTFFKAILGIQDNKVAVYLTRLCKTADAFLKVLEDCDLETCAEILNYYTALRNARVIVAESLATHPSLAGRLLGLLSKSKELERIAEIRMVVNEEPQSIRQVCMSALSSGTGCDDRLEDGPDDKPPAYVM